MDMEDRITKPEKTIKLSIIVPCYNVAKYLPRCLESLLAQTMDSIEVICINDGSADNSLHILRNYENRFSGRMLIIDRPNGGVWSARKEGIEAASGEYIGFLDPDDHVHPDFAIKLYDAAKADDADIACCGFDRIDEKTGKIFSREMTGKGHVTFDIHTDPGRLLEVNPALWNKIFRADLIKSMKDISTVPACLDDMIFINLIYINASVMTFVDASLVCYTVRSDSIISGLNREHIPGIYRSMCELRRIYSRYAPAMLVYLDAEAFLHLGISMLHRLSFTKRGCKAGDIADNRTFLDRRFPLWRRNPYIRLKYVIVHKGANMKLYMAHRLYCLHLFGPFLFFYRMMIIRFGTDIKW